MYLLTRFRPAFKITKFLPRPSCLCNSLSPALGTLTPKLSPPADILPQTTLTASMATEASSASSQTVSDQKRLRAMARLVVPPLGLDKHKGQAGRIGIIGGSHQYTGAPYFAAISALKVGADLVYVCCSKAAAPVIKSYSPELIVYPILDDENYMTELDPLLDKLHTLVIGPGLGKDEKLLKPTENIMKVARQKSVPLVIDADGVYLVTQNPDIVRGYTQAVLTPNAMEFSRLFNKMTSAKETDPQKAAYDLSNLLGNVAIVRKGPQDIITDGRNTLLVTSEGSGRRCGGQGDLLSGSAGTFLHWAIQATQQRQTDNKDLALFGPYLCAAFAGCTLTRECNRRAFQQHGRSMTTTDMITQIHPAFTTLFEESALNKL